jgi:hypothetical protein
MATIYGLAKKLEVTNAGTFATQSRNHVNVSSTPVAQTGLSLDTGGVIAAHVAIVDASGNQITSFGGGGGSGLTDTELRATAVPVSLASIPLATDAATDTGLSAIYTALGTIDSHLPGVGTAGTPDSDVITVQGVSNMTALIVASKDNSNQASLTASTQAQTFTNVQSFSAARVQITGTWSGTLTFQGSVDGTNFTDIYAQLVGGNGALVTTSTANGTYLINVSGLEKFRVYGTSIASGTAVIDTHLSIGGGPIQVAMPLPAGTNAIGKLASNTGVTIGAVEIAASQTLSTVTTVSTVTNLSQLGGSAIAMNTGVRSAGTQRVTIATDDIVQVGGTIAHDSVDANGPIKIGGKAVTGRPTAVSATGDRVDGYFDTHGMQFVRTANQYQDNGFCVNHVPAANTQATRNQAAAGAGLKNVCTGIHATFSANATAPTAVQVYVYLRDGASGSGTILWAATLSLPATAGASTGISITGLWIPGSANTSMTLEFSAAGGANTLEVVTLTGCIVAA